MRCTGTALLCLLLTCLAGHAARAEAAFQPTIPVLVYHQISTPEHPLPVNCDVIELSRFSEQMEYLHANGYQTISPANWSTSCSMALPSRKKLLCSTLMTVGKAHWRRCQSLSDMTSMLPFG